MEQEGQVAPSFQTGRGAGVDQGGSLTAAPLGAGLRITAGVNGRTGAAKLAGGTVVVGNTTVTAATIAVLTHKGDGGAVGILSQDPAANVPGVSFAINSTNGADAGHVSWILVEPIQ